MKRSILAGAVIILAAGAALAQTLAGVLQPVEPGRMVVLDTYGTWRMHQELAPPVLTTGEEAKFKYRWMDYHTPGAAKDWMQPQFDDAGWLRGPALLSGHTPFTSRICLRGKFNVADAGAAKELRLSVGYRGAIVVYLNGKALKREHFQAKQNLADGPAGEERTMSDLEIPAGELRKGLNVVAIELVRAPYEPTEESAAERFYLVNSCELVSARLTAAAGSAVTGSAIRPEGVQVWAADPMQEDYDLDFGDQTEAGRPVKIAGARNGMFTGKAVVGSREAIKGIKATVSDLAGQVGKVPASAVRIQYGVRCPGTEVASVNRNLDFSPYPTWPETLGGLSSEAPAECALTQFVAFKVSTGDFYKQAGRGNTPGWNKDIGGVAFRGDSNWYARYGMVPEELKPQPSCVAPIWLTVAVPRNTSAGLYKGTLTITMEGKPEASVPVELSVADFTLPDKDNYLTELDAIQSPDTLAMEYGVPLWSEKHWELIGQSLRMLGEAGCRTLYVPLIAHTNIGNEESMVRWVKKGQNRYEYDFGVMERYLDTAEKNMGKPRRIIFLVWDVYMMPKTPDKTAGAGGGRDQITRDNLDKLGGNYGRGPMVTALDRATGKTDVLELPTHFQGEASLRLWKPLFDQLHARLKKRNLDDKMMLGLLYDTYATKEEVALLKEAAGDVPWAMHSHEGFTLGKMLYGIVKVAYQARVWTVYYADDAAWERAGDKAQIDSRRGWSKRDVIVTEFARWNREFCPSTYWRQMPEANITGEQTGMGRVGGDMWPVMKDKKGARTGRAFQRYPESDWRNLIIVDALLAPGEKGPMETMRHIAVREGVQEAEARIAIEKALWDEAGRARLGAELARRCQDCLEARQRMMWLSMSDLQLAPRKPGDKSAVAVWWRGGAYVPDVSGHDWYLSAEHQKRSAELFGLAGEVEKKLGIAK